MHALDWCTSPKRSNRKRYSQWLLNPLSSYGLANLQSASYPIGRVKRLEASVHGYWASMKIGGEPNSITQFVNNIRQVLLDFSQRLQQDISEDVADYVLFWLQQLFLLRCSADWAWHRGKTTDRDRSKLSLSECWRKYWCESLLVCRPPMDGHWERNHHSCHCIDSWSMCLKVQWRRDYGSMSFTEKKSSIILTQLCRVYRDCSAMQGTKRFSHRSC